MMITFLSFMMGAVIIALVGIVVWGDIKNKELARELWMETDRMWKRMDEEFVRIRDVRHDPAICWNCATSHRSNRTSYVVKEPDGKVVEPINKEENEEDSEEKDETDNE